MTLDVFVDTSYLIAITDPRDQNAKAAAIAFARVSKARMHTSHEVLAEYLNFFSGRSKRMQALSAVEGITSSPNFIVHPQTPESFEAALELYRARPDKGYSLCDCRSMVLMDEIGIEQVLTNDEHFAQAGYKRLY